VEEEVEGPDRVGIFDSELKVEGRKEEQESPHAPVADAENEGRLVKGKTLGIDGRSSQVEEVEGRKEEKESLSDRVGVNAKRRCGELR
jgi:hypothetical protein